MKKLFAMYSGAVACSLLMWALIVSTALGIGSCAKKRQLFTDQEQIEQAHRVTQEAQEPSCEVVP